MAPRVEQKLPGTQTVYIVALTAVTLLWLKRLNASPIKVSFQLSQIGSCFWRRKSTSDARSIWNEFGASHGTRFVPPSASTPNPPVNPINPAGLGAFPEMSGVKGAPEEDVTRGCPSQWVHIGSSVRSTSVTEIKHRPPGWRMF